MYENINNEVVNIDKNILEDKEEEIMKSQIIQNRLENAIKKLEIRKENIVKNNKWVLSNIIYSKVYDLIMVTLLILFVISFVNKINLIISLHKTIYIVGVLLGVIVISIVGTYVSANVRDKLMYYYNKKRIVKISKCIREKENLLSEEKNKQERLKKEITNMMNALGSRLEMDVIECKKEFIDYTDCDMLNICKEKEGKEIINVKKKIKK